jgi:predicted DNA-binding ArsR family transcriptional regulator
MLKINRLKIKITATNKVYQFDECFSSGLNIIASDDNTRGKSSVLIAIYYCLGFEEIIGGLNEKVLTSAYKNQIEDKDTSWPVLESGAYLEISNGTDEITIYRSAKHETRDSKLVTVYFSKLDYIYNVDTTSEDYYVHMKFAATNRSGFHTFLEKFLQIELPLVPASDGVDRKLYLQLVFAAMFIEQKNGWSGIYSGMPYLAIKDAKKRVTEFILALETFENERKQNQLLNKERYQKEQWKNLFAEMRVFQSSAQCYVKNIPQIPEILPEKFEKNVAIVRMVGDNVGIDEWISQLQEEHDTLKTVRPRVIDNYDELQNELQEVEKVIEENNNEIHTIQQELNITTRKIQEINKNLDVIKQDITNNKDAKKLKILGSNLGAESFQGRCPVCNQKIQDSLLPVQHDTNVMSIEETINHLTAQKEMFEFAYEYQTNRKQQLSTALDNIRNVQMKLYRLAKSLRRDLYSVDEDLSETIIYKRMSIEHKIQELEDFKNKISNIVDRFKDLSVNWKKLLQEKAQLPEKGFNDKDRTKLTELKKNFICNLQDYEYTSISNVRAIEISDDNYLPVIDNFDMKFDSSASDNVRAIWAYTMALLQTSEKCGGNHPGLLIFDEPAQHSIGAVDTKAFFDSILNLGDNCQVIIGITINNADIREVISEIGEEKCNVVNIGEKAFE